MKSTLFAVLAVWLLAGSMAVAGSSPLADFSGEYKGTGQTFVVIKGSGVIAESYKGKFWASVSAGRKGMITLDGVLSSSGALIGFSTSYGIAATKLSYTYKLLAINAKTNTGKVKVTSSAITYSAKIVIDSQSTVVRGKIRKIGNSLVITEEYTYLSLQSDLSLLPITYTTRATLKRQ